MPAPVVAAGGAAAAKGGGAATAAKGGAAAAKGGTTAGGAAAAKGGSVAGANASGAKAANSGQSAQKIIKNIERAKDEADELKKDHEGGGGVFALVIVFILCGVMIIPLMMPTLIWGQFTHINEALNPIKAEDTQNELLDSEKFQATIKSREEKITEVIGGYLKDEKAEELKGINNIIKDRDDVSAFGTFSQIADVSDFELKDGGEKVELGRVVFDGYYGDKDEPDQTTRSAITTDTAITPTGSGVLSGYVIGIDPGHQAKANKGKEPVAPGSKTKKAKVSSGTAGVSTKIPEHELVLAVALKLKARLEAKGAKVVMTRDNANVDISNKERAEMMNKAGVNLCLRIHADGSDKASDKGAHIIVPKGIVPKDVETKSKKAGEDIFSEFLTETGATISTTIKGRSPNGVDPRSDLTGLNWSTVPSCLIELGFMSNKKEDKLLANDIYRAKCATGLAYGIEKYLKGSVTKTGTTYGSLANTPTEDNETTSQIETGEGAIETPSYTAFAPKAPKKTDTNKFAPKLPKKPKTKKKKPKASSPAAITTPSATEEKKTTEKAISMQLPPAWVLKKNSHTYMFKDSSTLRSSRQYKLAHNLLPGITIEKDDYGYCRVGSDYVVAMGSFYQSNNASAIGKTRFRITKKNGDKTYSFTTIAGDLKSDAHTNTEGVPKHSYHTGGANYVADYSVVEFLMWSRAIGVKQAPSRRFPGVITKIEKLSGPSSGNSDGDYDTPQTYEEDTAVWGYQEGYTNVDRKNVEIIAAAFSVKKTNGFPEFVEEPPKKKDEKWYQSVARHFKSVVINGVNTLKLIENEAGWVWDNITYEKQIKSWMGKISDKTEGFYNVTYEKNTKSAAYKNAKNKNASIEENLDMYLFDVGDDENIEKKGLKVLHPHIDFRMFTDDEFMKTLSDKEKKAFYQNYSDKAKPIDIIEDMGKQHSEMLQFDESEPIKIETWVPYAGMEEGTGVGTGDEANSASYEWVNPGLKIGGPLASKYLKSPSNGYGWHNNKKTHTRQFHKGADYPAPEKTSILSSLDGKVVYVGFTKKYGWMVRIDHGKLNKGDYKGKRLITLYAHMWGEEAIKVQVGDEVTKGQKIGEVGKTGEGIKIAHLHFEVRVGSGKDYSAYSPTDPGPWLTGGPSGAGAKLVMEAMKHLKTPYHWGGTGKCSNGSHKGDYPQCFDCSGFMQYLHTKVLGKSIPRVARAQYAGSKKIKLSELQVGDLVFFRTTYIHHVGMYIGGGKVIHAPQTGDVIKISPISGWNEQKLAGTYIR